MAVSRRTLVRRGQPMAQAAPAAAPANGAPTRLPFLWGTQPQNIPIAQINVTPGLKAPTQRIPKNGYLLKMLFRFSGNANVTAAGSAGTPNLLNLIGNYLLSYNGGFQYRNLDGESMYVMNLGRFAGANDCVQGSPNWKNYNPNSATNQTVGFVVEDEVGLNIYANADKYVLAAQARNADVVLDITFGSAASIAANTETVAISGTLFVEGLYLLDPPSYARFEEPNLRRVQQIEVDTSYTQVVVGDNTVSVVPVNGPRYLELYFKGQFNGVGDTQGFSSNISRIQLKINNGMNRIDMSSQALAQENIRELKRNLVGPTAAQTNAALPPGWYKLAFLDDVGVNNSVSQVGRNVISTERIAELWLIVTVAQGTNLTANNMIKLIKRVELPAVGGTNRLASPAGGG